MLRLLSTPNSHFSRKVRILSSASNIDLELVDIGNVASNSLLQFGNNPLMKVPTLVDSHSVVFDSDHIAQYLTRKFDPIDKYSVFVEDANSLNLRSVMNGIMSTEVELILSERSGLHTGGLVRFDKHRAAITHGLAWLERQADSFPSSREPIEQPSYADFHLVCMWDHLRLYGLVPLEPAKYPRLHGIVGRTSALPCVKDSSPLI